MASYFTIGGVSLSWTPTDISYGAGHHVTRHDLIGGGRSFDLMGTNPDDIVITGKMPIGNMSTDRIAIENMVGTQQTLVWGDDSADVIVLKAPFKQSFSHLEYTFTCAVVVPKSKNATVTAQNSAAGSVGQALGLNLPQEIQMPLATVSPILSGTSGLSTAIPGLTQAFSAAQTAITQADTTLSSFNMVAAGGSMSIASFVRGVTNNTAALATRVVASQASALISGAINSITNGG